MQNTHSVKFLRKRKFMAVLPLLVLPFVTMAFWLMGGGSANASSSSRAERIGLNLELPDAKLPGEENRDKLSFYNQAQEDSIRLRQEMMNDPFYRNRLDTMAVPVSFPVQPVETPGGSLLNPSPYRSGSNTSATEAKIYERLAALNSAVQEPEITSQASSVSIAPQSDLSGDITRLEGMVQVMNEKSGDDPEMKELNGMLEKILDIQHPERVKSRIKEKYVQKEAGVFSIENPDKNSGATYFGRKNQDTMKNKGNAFFGESFMEPSREPSNAVAAAIHQTQTVTTGSTIKLRLLEDIHIGGKVIPKGSFVFGVASIENERLLIDIPSLREGNNILPVSLKVFDMDGLAGIYIPGSIARDAVKGSADQSIQSIDLISLDPSIKAQAASAGIQTVKGLLSRKVKQVKATLKAGYTVLLRDVSNTNH